MRRLKDLGNATFRQRCRQLRDQFTAAVYLDPASRFTAKRCALVVWVIVILSLVLDRGRVAFVSNMTLMGSLIAVGLAIVFQDNFGRGPLNRWDEAVALYLVHSIAGHLA